MVTKIPDQLQTLYKIFWFDFMSRRETFLRDIYIRRRICCARSINFFGHKFYFPLILVDFSIVMYDNELRTRGRKI